MDPNINANYYSRTGVGNEYADVFDLMIALGNISNPEDPDYRDELFQLMLVNAALPYTLMDGTKGMRYAAELYTPRMKDEPLDVYQTRLMRTVLNNKLASTISKHSDRIFSTPVKIAGESEADLKVYDIFDNVTKTDVNLSSFLKSVYRDAKISGVSFMFIDSPPRTEGESAMNQFQKRAYLRHLTIKDILGIRTEYDPVDNSEKIVEFRYKYYDRVKKGFGFQQVLKVRQIQPFKETVWTLGRNNEGNRGWTSVTYETDMDQVLLFPYFTNRQGFLYAKPPLENLAYLNVQHWNSSSDHSNILHFTQMPILEIISIEPPEKMTLSSATSVWFKDNTSSIKYVEANCQSIKEGAAELANLERQMEEMSNEALMKPVMYETATGVDARQASLVSQLEAEAVDLQHVVDKTFKALLITSGYEDLIVRTEIGDGWYIEVNKDLGGITSYTDVKIQYLMEMRKLGDIPFDPFFRRMQEWGVAPANESIDKVKLALAEEKRLNRKDRLSILDENDPELIGAVTYDQDDIKSVMYVNPNMNDSMKASTESTKTSTQLAVKASNKPQAPAANSANGNGQGAPSKSAT